MTLRARRCPIAGEPDAPVVVTKIRASRASGFPRMASLGDRILVAWTDTAGPRLGVAMPVLADR